MQLYPMIFSPIFKDYLWGGRRLERFGRKLPDGKQIAESWEIAAHEDGMTVVENGDCAGKTLHSLVELMGEDLVGTQNYWALERGKFPLLVKLLDANEKLSVQVHPKDNYAQENENGSLGKTEMWVVLDATPEAAIIYGFSEEMNREKLRQAIKLGNLDAFLQKVKINRGDTICVPAGTLHAILAGAVIAEIQQNSNVTYRVYDWNRVGDDGRPRDLHVDKALDVINFNQVGYQISPPEVVNTTSAFIRERLCTNSYFATERLSIQPGGDYVGACNGASLEIWGVLEGEANIAGQFVSAVRFVLLPASMGQFEIHAPKGAVLLRTFSE